MEDIRAQLRTAIREYKIPLKAVEFLSQNPPLVIAGITASGKETTARRLEATSNWQQVTTTTTRRPRPGEKDGHDYWFVDENKMLQLLRAGLMIEAKFIHGETVYGISMSAYQGVLDAKLKPMLVIDVQGVEGILKYLPNLRPFFILPPSFEVWMERLDKRGHMSHVERVQRLASARKELETAINNEHFIMVVNDEIPRLVREITDNITDIPTQRRNRELAKLLIDHIKAY